MTQLLNCNYTLDFYLYCLVSKSWRAKLRAWLSTLRCCACLQLQVRSAAVSTTIGGGGRFTGLHGGAGKSGALGRAGAAAASDSSAESQAADQVATVDNTPVSPPHVQRSGTPVSIADEGKSVSTDSDCNVHLRQVVRRKSTDRLDKSFTAPPVFLVVTADSPQQPAKTETNRVGGSHQSLNSQGQQQEQQQQQSLAGTS